MCVQRQREAFSKKDEESSLGELYDRLCGRSFFGKASDMCGRRWRKRVKGNQYKREENKLGFWRMCLLIRAIINSYDFNFENFIILEG